MKGDFHVWFCERLAGETPACLFGVCRERTWFSMRELLITWESGLPQSSWKHTHTRINKKPAANNLNNLNNKAKITYIFVQKYIF